MCSAALVFPSYCDSRLPSLVRRPTIDHFAPAPTKVDLDSEMKGIRSSPGMGEVPAPLGRMGGDVHVQG